MAKTTYSREELERQLAESRREFLAADATINNLELKLADMAAQLANAENKCRELAAENAGLNFYLRNGPVIRKGGELVAAHQFAPETPATDALLDEVRSQGVEMAISQAFRDVIPANRMQFISRMTNFAAQLRKGGNQ